MEPPVKQRKEPWYYNTINRLSDYKRNFDRVNSLTKELSMLGSKTTVTYSDMPHGSGVSDSCGDLATKVGDKNTELIEKQNEVMLIEYVVSILSEQKQLIIRTRFMTEGGQDKGAFITLGNHARRYKWRAKNYRTYEKLREEAIEEIAGMLGEK